MERSSSQPVGFEIDRDAKIKTWKNFCRKCEKSGIYIDNPTRSIFAQCQYKFSAENTGGVNGFVVVEAIKSDAPKGQIIVVNSKTPSEPVRLWRRREGDLHCGLARETRGVGSLSEYITYGDLCEIACKNWNLVMCPFEVALRLRLGYRNQPMNEKLLVACRPIFSKQNNRSYLVSIEHDYSRGLHLTVRAVSASSDDPRKLGKIVFAEPNYA